MLRKLPRFKMKALLLIVLVLTTLVLNCPAYNALDTAQTIASDGSYADTMAALAYVTGKNQDGWVLTIGSPGVTYTWPGTLAIAPTGKLTIQGASDSNRPQILFSAATYADVFISASSNRLVTLKDLIIGWTGNQPSGCIVGVGGTGVCFRLSNCQFTQDASSKFVVQVGSVNSINAPGPYGVVDHCQFLLPFNDTFNLINIRANGCVNNYGWTLPMTWGSSNTVVIEDCQFSVPKGAPVGAAVEADAGARFTIRNCAITNIPVSSHGVASGAKCSTLQIECYKNNFYLTDANNTMPYMYWQRGGTCVLWSNTISSVSFWSLAKVFYFSVECASSQWAAESCSNHLAYPGDYPGYQQVGQGVVNGKQGSVPVYLWGNKTPGTYYGDNAFGMDGGDAPFIQIGRDIYTNTVMPGYTALVYPHPLVASGGTTPPSGTGNATTPSTSVIPPANLQAHPPVKQ
jgi:hypothetical protein